MKAYKNREFREMMGGLMIVILFFVIVGWAISLSFDPSKPILSERNPDGSVGAWFLFDNAYAGGSHE